MLLVIGHFSILIYYLLPITYYLLLKMANHLEKSQSLYLRKHAHNPINWWYWCEEALNIAKTENKPIFLSIGYSSCHWCTVMENEAFSDDQIADYLNQNFVAIKVDREERPDLDSIYMQSLQMMTGQGGWPLNIFLDPVDHIPFYGGTYFPIEPRYGKPGFLQLLQSLKRFYEQETEKLTTFKNEILSHLQQSTLLPIYDSNNQNLNDPELLYSSIVINTNIIRPHPTGRPCFPMIPYSQLALQGTKLNPLIFQNLKENYDSNQAQKLTQQRGLDLALGGIYDHVGGGFHRYTVDATWTVPHFEKMLYDNGQIVEYLSNLWSSGLKIPAFERAIAGTIQWLSREMRASEGYFYAAQDADNFVNSEEKEPEEGAFYIWEYEQLENILKPEELFLLKEEFMINPQGNFEGKIVLQRTQNQQFSEEIEQILEKLFIKRYGESSTNLKTFPRARNNQEAKTINWQGRIPPVTDTKMIVSWNSLMISGLARAYGVFKEKSYLEIAEQAINFILNNQFINERLYRLNYDGKVTVLAQSEDYAFLIKSLLDLHFANPKNQNWLNQAIKIQEQFDQYFWSIEMGGYFNNGSDEKEQLLIKERNYIDNATPSPNGIALSNLMRLFLSTENQEYLRKTEQGLKVFSHFMEQSPQGCPTLVSALNLYQNGKVVKTNLDIIDSLNSQYFPTTVYQVVNNFSNNYIGMVCQGLSCLEPAQTLDQLINQLT